MFGVGAAKYSPVRLGSIMDYLVDLVPVDVEVLVGVGRRIVGGGRWRHDHRRGTGRGGGRGGRGRRGGTARHGRHDDEVLNLQLLF